ncbi:MAG: hypothetical protein NTX65_16055 [Ignavibacteriales bacterium]|nr:hypothetical protein [Ignavibacteriales bacterium]
MLLVVRIIKRTKAKPHHKLRIVHSTNNYSLLYHSTYKIKEKQLYGSEEIGLVYAAAYTSTFLNQ